MWRMWKNFFFDLETIFWSCCSQLIFYLWLAWKLYFFVWVNNNLRVYDRLLAAKSSWCFFLNNYVYFDGGLFGLRSSMFALNLLSWLLLGRLVVSTWWWSGCVSHWRACDMVKVATMIQVYVDEKVSAWGRNIKEEFTPEGKIIEIQCELEVLHCLKKWRLRTF